MKPPLPTGRKIVLELVNEMEARLYPLLYRTLAPSVYHVYLHPDDYKEIEAITPLIVADAQRGLEARVESLNRRSKWKNLVSGGEAQIEVPKGGWEIHLRPDANGELSRGALGIVSRLSLPVQPSYDTGTPTTRIARTVVTGTIRRTATSEERSAAGDAASAIAPSAVTLPPPAVAAANTEMPSRQPLTTNHQPLTASANAPAASPLSSPQPSTIAAQPPVMLPPLPTFAPSPSTPAPSVSTPLIAPSHNTNMVATATAERVASVAPTEAIAVGGFARLAYIDDQGPHVFVMRKEVVSIGRGGSAHWVDVQVASTQRVSREHCRIRRDSQGRFFLQDISTWGTSVNGETIAPFLRHTDGRVEETGQERELPRQARIQLADAVVIEFEAQQVR